MHVLEVKDVSKSFPLPSQDGDSGANRLSVLGGVSFVVEHGETVAIMGPSGGGKSTLLSLLSGLDRPDQGQIMVLDQDIAAMNSTELNSFRARSIGIVFQQFQLLEHFTALENVRLPLDLRGVPAREADRIAHEKLDRVGLKDRSHHFPDQMSRGECQRVAIARVLAMGAPLIFADEPTGSLDAKNGKAVMDLLFASAKELGAAVVLVTHDAELAKRCHRTLKIENGRLS
ncbi:MAG: ABC transporter ATP-binding protein [Bdellovibrionaceae bacterium]|nr:ABC transporter ATP-binding protein [Pseudobdellovibrionaceae bacterium]